MINLTNLYYFKVVAERENMTKAAEQLFISQPALSKAILNLEQSLGVTLFERTKGRIRLSAIGRTYYGYISSAFSAIEAGNEKLEELKNEANDRVSIASPVGDLLNSMILGFMQEVCANVQINQFLYAPHEAEKMLMEGRLDFVITPITMESNEIEHTKWMEEEIVLVVSRDHPLAGKGCARLWDVRNDSFLVNEASFDKKIVTVHCELAGFTPTIALYSNENSVIHRALQQNLGVSLVPGNVLLRDGARAMEGLVPLRISDVKIVRMIGMATRKDAILSPNAQKLVRYAGKYFTRLGGEIADYLDSVLPPVDPAAQRSLGIENIRTPAASMAAMEQTKHGG